MTALIELLLEQIAPSLLLGFGCMHYVEGWFGVLGWVQNSSRNGGNTYTNF